MSIGSGSEACLTWSGGLSWPGALRAWGPAHGARAEVWGRGSRVRSWLRAGGGGRPRKPAALRTRRPLTPRLTPSHERPLPPSCAPLGHTRAKTDTGNVCPTSDDWRRMGQESYLLGATLTWKRYQPRRPNWEHEHCDFCLRKFLDPNYGPSHVKMLRDNPDISAVAGYTNLRDSERPAGEWWICEECFGEFADELQWTTVETDPDAWPYEPPTPSPTPRPPERHAARSADSATGHDHPRPLDKPRSISAVAAESGDQLDHCVKRGL